MPENAVANLPANTSQYVVNWSNQKYGQKPQQQTNVTLETAPFYDPESGKWWAKANGEWYGYDPNNPSQSNIPDWMLASFKQAAGQQGTPTQSAPGNSPYYQLNAGGGQATAAPRTPGAGSLQIAPQQANVEPQQLINDFLNGNWDVVYGALINSMKSAGASQVFLQWLRGQSGAYEQQFLGGLGQQALGGQIPSNQVTDFLGGLSGGMVQNMNPQALQSPFTRAMTGTSQLQAPTWTPAAPLQAGV